MRIFYAFTACAAFLIGSISMHAQAVKGTVRDDAGTLPGVVVKDVANTAGTSTNIDGQYTLSLKPGKHTLEFKMVGFVTAKREITLVADQILTLDVTMEPEDNDLDEIVVVGYGVQRKREVTGSISKIDGKELTKLPVPSFEAALQGQAAGVAVSQGSGMAGSGSLIRVRGISSISAGGDPLYVIDGLPIVQDPFLQGNSAGFNNNPLANINPADIESIEVLKDAAATGIYGSRGANGVILITTKRGSKTKKGVQFDFSTRLGIGVAATRPNMMNTEQYLAVRQEAWENDGGTGYVWLPGVRYETASGSAASASALERQQQFERAKLIDTDWVDQTIGVGFKQTYNFAATYSNDKLSLYSGVSYDDNGSFMRGNSYERISGRTNLDYTFSKKLKVMTNLSYSVGLNNRVDAAWSGGLGYAMSQALPYYPVLIDSTSIALFGNVNNQGIGGYFPTPNGNNPVQRRETFVLRTDDKRLLSNATVIYSPIKDLNIKASGSYEYSDVSNNEFFPIIDPNQAFTSANRNFAWTNNWNSSLTADYTKEIREGHRLTLLAGAEIQESRTTFVNWNYQNVTSAPFTSGFDDNGDFELRKSSPRLQRWTFVSTFARANYSIKDKYFVQLVSRVDGSSRFGVNNKYGYFPTASAGWIISEEKWFNKTKAVNFLKIRSGWGISGNSDIPPLAQFSTYDTTGFIFYNGNPIIFPTQFGNPDLSWENTRTVDVTLEVGLLKDRLNVQVSYYDKLTTNALMAVSIPQSTGFGTYWDNAAQILNRGIELTVTSYNIVRPNFEWKTDFNIARNYNELLDIGDYTPDAISGGTNDSRVIVGKPIGSFYLMKFSHVDPETGLPVYLDANGNETFDYDNFQRQYVGDGLPDAVGGITNSFRYKQWDMQILATFSLGAKIFDSSGKRQLGVVTDWNMRTDILDRWRQPGDEATFARLTLDETNYGLNAGFPWWNTSLFVYDADFLRIRNVALGYTFKLKKESKLQNLRVVANATNLFTFTNFPGLDPELVRDFENPQDRNMSPNVTYLTPPQERSFNISINANF